jgi:hypothetical protein
MLAGVSLSSSGLATGGIRLQTIGLWWLFIGVAFSTW